MEPKDVTVTINGEPCTGWSEGSFTHGDVPATKTWEGEAELDSGMIIKVTGKDEMQMKRFLIQVIAFAKAEDEGRILSNG